jgi:thiazole synthase
LNGKPSARNSARPSSSFVAVVTTVAVSATDDFVAENGSGNTALALTEGFQSGFVACVVLAGIGLVLTSPLVALAALAKKLEDAGAAAVMPLAAPIGSGLGVQNPNNLRIMREQITEVPIIVDAGVGTASDACFAMELGVDGVLMNTAIAEAGNPGEMAEAMKFAVRSGRLAYLAVRMEKRSYASASSPLVGVVR